MTLIQACWILPVGGLCEVVNATLVGRALGLGDAVRAALELAVTAAERVLASVDVLRGSGTGTESRVHKGIIIEELTVG